MYIKAVAVHIPPYPHFYTCQRYVHIVLFSYTQGHVPCTALTAVATVAINHCLLVTVCTVYRIFTSFMSFNNFFFSFHNYIMPLLASHATILIHDERLHFVCDEQYVDTVVRYVLCMNGKRGAAS